MTIQSTQNLSDYFDRKDVLVAGASGMTGLNLFEKLVSFGAYVTGTYCNSVVPFLERADFTDYSVADKMTKNVDYVFICAAKTYNACVCSDNPQSMILPNIQIVSNLLDCSLKNNVKKVLYISSATVYQPSLNKLTEDCLDLNKDPYELYMGVGWMKRYAEKLCSFYAKRGLNVVVVRPTNIYGRYDKTDPRLCHFVPAMLLKSLKKENPFNVLGNGTAVRDFIYIDDLIRDLLRVFVNHNSPDPINLCSEELLSVDEVVKIILQETGFNPVINYLGKDKEEPVPFRSVSRSKLDSLYGKESYVKFTEGIKRTIPCYS